MLESGRKKLRCLYDAAVRPRSETGHNKQPTNAWAMLPASPAAPRTRRMMIVRVYAAVPELALGRARVTRSCLIGRWVRYRAGTCRGRRAVCGIK